MKDNHLVRALALIPRSQHKRGVLIIALLSIAAFLDFFSLASFVPLILLTIKPENFGTNAIITRINSFFGFHNPTDLAIALTLTSLIFVFLKTLANTYITRLKTRYAYAIGNKIATRGMEQFLNTPYLDFTKMDFSKEMNRLSNLPLMFANNFIIPLGTVLSELCIAAFLIVVLVTYELKIFLFLLAVVAPVTIIFQFQRRAIRKASEEIKVQYPQLLKETLKAVEGLPEIRSFGKESFFAGVFNRSFARVGNLFARDHTVHTGVGRITELMAAVCIGTMILYFLATQKTPGESAMLLTIYAGVTFRIIPSFNRIFSSLIQIKTHYHIIDELERQLQESPVRSSPGLKHAFQNAIKIENVSFEYENGSNVFDDASLIINKGEKIILQGKSGSGKTTLYLLLMGFVQPQHGKILIDGIVVDQSRSDLRTLMGYVSQSPYMLDATLLENIAFGIPPEKIDGTKVTRLIDDLDLADWVKSLPSGMNTVIGEKGAKVSGGQRQRIAIARALYHDAEILLLDEITNQLDAETEIEVMRTLKKLENKQTTILLITHRPALWTSFNAAYKLQKGKFEKIDTKSLASAM